MIKLLLVILAFAFIAKQSSAAEEYVYYPSVNKHYKFHKDAQMWHVASSTCRREGAVLATPRNAAEAAILVQIHQKYPSAGLGQMRFPDYQFIGLHDAFVENIFMSENGEPVANFYVLWPSGEPGNYLNEDCVTLHRNQHTYDVGCDQMSVFTCEKNPAAIVPMPINDPAYLPHPALGKKYKLHATPMAWHYAVDVCRKEQATLAMPYTTAEINTLKTLFVGKYDFIFLGFHDAFIEGEFLDLKGDPIEMHDNAWERGQPDNANHDENCGTMKTSGELADISCAVPGVFVCQKDMEQKPPAKKSKPNPPKKPVNPNTVAGYVYSPTVNRHHKFHKDAQVWHVAAKTCRREGGRLATPRDSTEAALLIQIFSQNPTATLPSLYYPDYLHIGLHDAFVEGVFMSEAGEPGANYYTRWPSGQPDNQLNEDCITLNRNSYTYDLGCERICPFICEIIPASPELPVRPDPAYVPYPAIGKQYKVHTTSMAWHYAVDVCQKEQATLAMPYTTAEITVLKSLFAEKHNFIFMGFHDAFIEGNYLDLKGDPLRMHDNKWGPGQPDDKDNNEDCGSMSTSGQLVDISCTQPGIFVCERNMPQTEQPTTTRRPATTTATPDKPETSIADTVFDSASNRRYKLHMNPKNWLEANRLCLKEHSYLAVINSQKEAGVIASILSAHDSEMPAGSSTPVFLGLSNMVIDGVFTTNEGISMQSVGYNSWAPDQPAKSLNCGALLSSGKLTAAACNTPSWFICEKPVQAERARSWCRETKPIDTSETQKQSFGFQ